MTDAERARAAVEVVAASGAPCLLCGGVADGVGCFVPERADYRAAVDAPEGKARVLLYPACSRCAAVAGPETVQ